MLPNKGTFVLGGGGSKDRSLTKIRRYPGSMKYIQEMLASQQGEKPSRTISTAEEEIQFNRIWNEDYRKLRR
jgi:hypothetical protein